MEQGCQVGVAGHRFFAEPERIRVGIERAMRCIEQAYPGRCLTLFSSLAEGADQLTAQNVLSLQGGRLVVVLPLPADDYARAFTTDAARAEFWILLGRADTVLTLPAVSNRDEAYENAGSLIVATCHVLLAVWDGRPSQGRGGTGEVVAKARAARKPLVIVRAGNRRPGTDEPTTLGEAEGQVMTENVPTAVSGFAEQVSIPASVHRYTHHGCPPP